jgi:predicted nucleic acid-binding Zn ribbon protein
MGPKASRARQKASLGAQRGSAGPQPVRVSLIELAGRLGAPSTVELGALRSHWESLVGGHLAARTWPTSLADGVLTVVAQTGAWAAELRFHTTTVLQRVQGVAPSVVSVVVKVGTKDGQSW